MNTLADGLKRIEEIEARRNGGGIAAVDTSSASASSKINTLEHGLARLEEISTQRDVDSIKTGLSQFGIEVDDAVLQRAKENYAKTFKSDYDLGYDMERRANDLMPVSYDKKYDADSELDRYFYESLLPNKKDFQEAYNKAADELNKEREERRKEQEKLWEEQAPQRQYAALVKDISGNLDLFKDDLGVLS